MIETRKVSDVRWPGTAALARKARGWEVSFLPERGVAQSRRFPRTREARFCFNAVVAHGADGLLFPLPEKGLTAYRLHEEIPERIATQPFYVYLRLSVSPEEWYDAVRGALRTCRAGAYDIARTLVEQGFAVGFNWGDILHNATLALFEALVAVDSYAELPAFVLDKREWFVNNPQVLLVTDPERAALWEERRLARMEEAGHV